MFRALVFGLAVAYQHLISDVLLRLSCDFLSNVHVVLY